MSATNRKKSGGETTTREALDHYPTLPWVTRVLVQRIGFPLQGKRVLECAAGDGAMVNVLADAGAIVDAVELDSWRAQTIRRSERARQVVTGDFLLDTTTAQLEAVKRASAPNAAKPYDVVISNPPYGMIVPVLGPDGQPVTRKVKGKIKTITTYRDLAREFAEKAMTLAPVVAFVLRLNWAGSIGRVGFHEKHPADLVILANRPKFKAGSQGDATEYAWWIWREGATVGTWIVHFSDEAPSRGRPKGKVEIVDPKESGTWVTPPGVSAVEIIGDPNGGGGGGGSDYALEQESRELSAGPSPAEAEAGGGC